MCRADEPPPNGYAVDPKTLGYPLCSRRLEPGLLQAGVAETLGNTVDTIRN